MMVNMADFQANSTYDDYVTTSQDYTSDPQDKSSEEMDNTKRLVYITEAHIEPMIFIFGIVTNFLSFIIIRQMRISKVIKTLLLSLTVSDFLASVLGFLNILLEVVYFRGEMPYGIWKRGVVETFTAYKIYLMFIGISSALVILIAIVRCYSMLNPFEWTATVTHRRVVKAIIVIVIVTVLMFIPLSLYIMWKACFFYEQNPESINSVPDDDPQVCLAFFDIFPDAWKVRYYFFAITLLLGPGTVISNLVCFILLKRAINKSARNIRHMQERRGSESSILDHQNHRNVRLNRMFLWVLFFNSICITPSIIQVICLQIDPQRFLFDKSNIFVAITDIIAEVFLGALPCYNFWTYLIVNKDFRKRYKLMCCCCCVKKTKDPFSSNSKTPEPSPRPERIYIGELRGNQV